MLFVRMEEQVERECETDEEKAVNYIDHQPCDDRRDGSIFVEDDFGVAGAGNVYGCGSGGGDGVGDVG